MSAVNKFMIEGIDRLGKDTLIGGIQHKRGYHQVMHFTKPVQLECYTPSEAGDPVESKREALFRYQEHSFRTMFSILRDARYANIICNRAHLGENVYAPLYRGYNGSYVFDLERAMMRDVKNTRLVLLIEDFAVAEHFIDDGDSFDTTKRIQEQELFLAAFERSSIKDKRIVCVTDRAVGGFRVPGQILEEVLA
jgi:hypothetical protein